MESQFQFQVNRRRFDEDISTRVSVAIEMKNLIWHGHIAEITRPTGERAEEREAGRVVAESLQLSELMGNGNGYAPLTTPERIIKNLKDTPSAQTSVEETLSEFNTSQIPSLTCLRLQRILHPPLPAPQIPQNDLREPAHLYPVRQ
jgi:hypothetical protein